jgi:hypothetical protein
VSITTTEEAEIMANPRAIVDYMGIGFKAITMVADGTTIVYDSTKNNGSASVGLAVQATGNNIAALTVDASEVLGRLERVEADGMCVVQIEGGCELPAGNAATVTAGTRIVGALGAAAAPGYIRNVAGATAAEGAVAGHRILDATVTTAVKVMLGD